MQDNVLHLKLKAVQFFFLVPLQVTNSKKMQSINQSKERDTSPIPQTYLFNFSHSERRRQEIPQALPFRCFGVKSALSHYPSHKQVLKQMHTRHLSNHVEDFGFFAPLIFVKTCKSENSHSNRSVALRKTKHNSTLTLLSVKQSKSLCRMFFSISKSDMTRHGSRPS